MNKKKAKQSLLIAALTSSFGIFVSKALGLLYYSPLSHLAGEDNMVFYSITYTYYDLLLKISSAGLPFAIAALVARYVSRGEYKNVLLVKKLGTSLIMGLSFLVAIIFVFASGPIAAQSMGSNASAEDIKHLKDLFMILEIAVILVPFLSAIRGYYQGLKRLDLYGSSQALEQFIRVSSIIVLGFVFVRILNFDSIYAIYCAIAAAGIAALFTIIFFLFFGRSDDKHIKELIKTDNNPERQKSYIISELLSIGIPYLIISFLGSLSALVNTTFFLDTVTKAGMNVSQAKLSMGILQANCNKLSAIPQVLTLGFSAGLVPYLIESYEQGDIKKLAKQITQIIETVLYILIPALLMFVFYAKDIYYIMYGNNNLELSTSLFKASNMVTFTDTIAPILSSIMITLKLRKEATITLIVSILVKLISFFPLVNSLGAYGMCISTAISSLFVIIAYLLILKYKFGIRFIKTIRRALAIIIVSVLAVVPLAILANLIPLDYSSRLLHILKMGVVGFNTVLIYYFASAAINIPQVIFGIKKLTFDKLLARFRR